ncbi:MAG: nuclear transport factor 2 family protein, partial [Chloroflexi bacterium]
MAQSSKSSESSGSSGCIGKNFVKKGKVMPIDENEIAVHRTLVNRWIEAFNEHNVSAIVALYADNAELFDSGMKHPRRGRKEIERWFIKRFQSMPSITYIPVYHLFPLYQLFNEAQAAVTW